MTEIEPEVKEAAPRLVVSEEPGPEPVPVPAAAATVPQAIALVAEPDRLVGTYLEDKILIESVLGHGGTSIVYRARHLALDRAVAVKVLFPGPGMTSKMILRLQQEARTAFSLSHENLASVHDVAVTADGLPYLIMDLAEGVTLASMIEGGPLKTDLALDIFCQISAGLMAAHDKQIVHRDIKPSNIVVQDLGDGKYRARIVDFGIAKKVSESGEEANRLTQTGEVFGTPFYMSPEQCRGDKLDERADIYSLGCVMYEALTGSPPFVGENAIATIMAHLSKPLPVPPAELKISQNLIDLLHHCMEKKATERYQSMSALHADLVAIKETGKTIGNARLTARKKRNIKIAVGVLSGVFILGLMVAPIVQRSLDPWRLYESIPACNATLAKHPDDYRALLERGKHYRDKNEYTKAVADFTDAIKLYRDYAPAYAYRGSTCYSMGKSQQALVDLSRAIELDPTGQVWAFRDRAIVNQQLGNYEKTVADATAYLRQVPRDLYTLLMRAQAYRSLKNYDAAARDVRRCLGISTTWGAAYAEMAKIENLRGNFAEAEAMGTKAIETNREVGGYIQRGLARYEQFRYDDALADEKTAQELDPENLRAMLIESRIYQKQNKLKEALSKVTEVLRLSPNWDEASNLQWQIKEQMRKP